MNFLLIPFSFLYLLIICLRNLFYNTGIFKQYKIGAKVISVGNITWGGTGKTPVTAFIAGLFLRQGIKPVILLRGYGNDEESLFSRLAPGVKVIVGKDRVRSGQKAMADNSPDVILLDDGFQYRRLKRDLDIVCIDAANPFGNGCLIPAGSLREGLSGLKRVDIFLLTKVDLVKDLERLEDKLKKVNPKALIVKSIHRVKHFYRLSDNEIVDTIEFKNKDVALVSAIGNPVSFEKTILGLGLKPKKHFIFRDHHRYTNEDLDKIREYCIKNKIDTLITTEKDAIKLTRRVIPSTFASLSVNSARNLLEGKIASSRPSVGTRNDNYGTTYADWGLELLVLKVRLEIIDNEQGFHNRLLGIRNS